MPRRLLVDAAFVLGSLVWVPLVTNKVFGYPPPWPLDVAFPVSLAALLLARRRWPVGVLLVSVALVVALRTADLVLVGWLWPVAGALLSALLYGRLWWVVGVASVTLGFGFAWESGVGVGGGGPRSLVVDALCLVALLVATGAYRNRRRRQESEEARQQAEERLRVAREVHDIVAHTLTVVGVQLRVAAESLTDAPDEARAAIETAQAARRSALEDLRGLVDVLRSSPTAGLDDLPRVVAAVNGAELTVDLIETGEPRPVPAPVGLGLTRVVQEALTNVVRHATASRARVEVHYGPSTVSVTVSDDGRGGAAVGGRGLSGLRERVEALGGTFTAGPAPTGGFAVHASVRVP